MEGSVFTDKSKPPDAAALARALGPRAGLWAAIETELREALGSLDFEWKHYGAKSGWTLKVLLKKRNLFFLTPGPGRFRVAFVFGDRAVAAVAEAGFPEKLVAELRTARGYAEGRGLRIEVECAADARTVAALARIKAAIASGADAVVSACPSCKNSLNQAAARARKEKIGKIKVLDLTELVAGRLA